MNFAIYYANDAFTTDKKIMGRQNAGKTLMKGVARRWATNEVHGFGPDRKAGEAMARQLREYDFTGIVRWRPYPGDRTLEELGAVYFPAPPERSLAHARNTYGPASYSIFGVTHTLSSTGAMDLVGDLALPPFQPWDALICTSAAAKSVVMRLQDEMREWLSSKIGATCFNPIQLPIIPLGVDAPAFARDEAATAQARQAMQIATDEIVFLFAGRLSFHAKANPAPFYLALEEACRRTGLKLVCMEAGNFYNDGIKQAFIQAQKALAPSARFINIDGRDEVLYHQAWRAADTFVSLSDNIQETFGITPVEAMSAGLPVLVSDWDGYRDTIRDGIDGYRIATALPPQGVGEFLAKRHALRQESYDHYIGRVSMATIVDVETLTERIVALASDSALRRRLGEAGARRARDVYDWPVILGRYASLANDLAEIRKTAQDQAPPERWPCRPDPFVLFSDYASAAIAADWKVVAQGEGTPKTFLDLTVTSYVLDPLLLPQDTILALHAGARLGETTAGELIAKVGGAPDVAWRCLTWLAKLDLVTLKP